jgi:hypothetical protein
VPRARVILTEGFISDASGISGDDSLARVESLLRALADYPDLGSPLARPSLSNRFGDDVRKMVIGRYLLVYRHVGDEVRVLGLRYGPSVR